MPDPPMKALANGIPHKRVLLVGLLLLAALALLGWPALREIYARFGCWRVGATAIGGGMCVFIDHAPQPPMR